jgi:hypothetical protein
MSPVLLQFVLRITSPEEAWVSDARRPARRGIDEFARTKPEQERHAIFLSSWMDRLLVRRVDSNLGTTILSAMMEA